MRMSPVTSRDSSQTMSAERPRPRDATAHLRPGTSRCDDGSLVLSCLRDTVMHRLKRVPSMRGPRHPHTTLYNSESLPQSLRRSRIASKVTALWEASKAPVKDNKARRASRVKRCFILFSHHSSSFTSILRLDAFSASHAPTRPSIRRGHDRQSYRRGTGLTTSPGTKDHSFAPCSGLIPTSRPGVLRITTPSARYGNPGSASAAARGPALALHHGRRIRYRIRSGPRRSP